MTNQEHSEMAEFFDFNQAAVPEHGEGQNIADAHQYIAAGAPIDLSPDSIGNDLLNDDIIRNFDLPPHNESDSSVNDNNAEYWSNFSKWLPSYRRPDQPCDYCRSKHLDCRFSFVGQETCEACINLFRPCSFVSKLPKSKSFMDTLGVVNEDHCIEKGRMTGVKAMFSYDRAGAEAHDDDDDERPSRKTGTRFPRTAIKILRDWMDQHKEHPYPTEEEKEKLRTRTGLKASQISNWLANTRRRTKIHTPRGVSPSMRRPTWATEQTAAVDIPFDKGSIRHNGKTWDIMNPLERYIESPPENEPAPVAIIKEVAEKTRVNSTSSSGSSQRRSHGSSAGSGSLQHHRAPSLTSLETGQTGVSDSHLSSNSLSNLSLGSSQSYGSRNSFGSHASDRLKQRRRRKRTAANPGRNQPPETRPFQCTFCTDTFRTKYDWSRHEKSLHLSLEKWICAPLGPVIFNPATGLKHCVFCDEANPSEEHLASHNREQCDDKGLESRTFYRKDHLRQHLRLVHGCKLIDSMDLWKVEAAKVRSRCGFCRQDFTTWQERTDHLAKHFKSGAQMSQWKGCRGFDPEIATLVQNAMPPYLIANEAKSPLPFSASNTHSLTQHTRWMPVSRDLEAVMPESGAPLGPDPHFSAMSVNSLPPKIGTITFSAGDEQYINTCSLAGMSTVNETCALTATTDAFPTSIDTIDMAAHPARRDIRISTCWQVLTLRLGHFVKEQMAQGVVPTDEQLQCQARWILFGDDDSWNQTAADHPEWLDLFKKAHGLGGLNSQPANVAHMLDDFGLDDIAINMNMQQHQRKAPLQNILLDDFGLDITRAMDLNDDGADIDISAPPASTWADILATTHTSSGQQNLFSEDMLMTGLTTTADDLLGFPGISAAGGGLNPFDFSSTSTAGGVDFSTGATAFPATSTAGPESTGMDFTDADLQNLQAVAGGGNGMSGLSMLFAGHGRCS